MQNDAKGELKRLKARVATLQERAREMKEQIERLSGTGRRKRYAVVERSQCTGCGLCAELCPAGAIRVTYVAHVDTDRCIGCGTCAENCPQGAIHLATVRTTSAGGPQGA